MNSKTAPSPTITINRRLVGEDHPTYIIAEIGINHNGDEKLALQLIEAAAEAKVDAVKFQKRHLPSLYRQDVLAQPEKFEQNFQYMIPLLKEVELADGAMARLQRRAMELGLDFLCTPFDPVSADLLRQLNLPAYKVASADLTNLDLISNLAADGKPLILSTGMSHWEEIEDTVDRLRQLQTPFALLHCRSVYPVWPREVNLRMMNKLRRFNCPVGYSGHELGIVIPLAAASMGAAIIEKHLTLDRKMRGPDHKVSLEPYEFKRLVRDIRIADQAVGKSKRFLLRGEVLNRELFGKSLIAAADIAPGTEIRREMVLVQGPGKGLSPQKLPTLLGAKAKRRIAAGDFFRESDLPTAEATAPDPAALNFKGEWGLIARFTDGQAMLAHRPRSIEFHLAEKDFALSHGIDQPCDCRLIVHAPEYIGDKIHDLASGDENIRRQSVAQTLQALAVTRELAPFFRGRPKLVTHPGAMSMNTKLRPELLAAALARSVREIKAAIVGDEIELLLENLPPYPWYFGGQWKGNYFMAAEEIAAFCRQEEINICFDLSHAALYCNAKDQDLADYIQTLRPLIRHIHFADAYGLDGEGVQIGEGDIDLDRIMPLFAGYRGTWMPEIWRGHLENGAGFITALQRLSKYDL